LVISGLAGRLTNNSLTKPERKKALTMMKESRTELINQVEDLTTRQLLFKPNNRKKNIRDYIIHIAGSEKKLWGMLEQAMKVNSSPSQRADVVMEDNELIAHVEDRSENGIAYDPFLDLGHNYKTYGEALEGFKKQRMDHIRYLRTSTQDLRNHVVRLSFGTIDCYQLCLLIAAHASRHTADIRSIMKDPSFPK
jgi:hypothetical protein